MIDVSSFFYRTYKLLQPRRYRLRPYNRAIANIFKTVQNKMHWGARGNTGAEVIYKRIDAEKPNIDCSKLIADLNTRCWSASNCLVVIIFTQQANLSENFPLFIFG